VSIGRGSSSEPLAAAHVKTTGQLMSVHRALSRFENDKRLEWRDNPGCHDDWIPACFPLPDAGQQAYASFTRSGIEGHPLVTCKK